MNKDTQGANDDSKSKTRRGWKNCKFIELQNRYTTRFDGGGAALGPTGLEDVVAEGLDAKAAIRPWRCKNRQKVLTKRRFMRLYHVGGRRTKASRPIAHVGEDRCQ